ncbi:metalloregulator ArsR/SmtB family transcription factor [Desulfosporosinus sp. FKB]|uniref:ArsR/SmtB family transcription factor n=1 Tax=unclassified Desulfosporosinus TaxID=2633794 RepID=UPI001FA9031D|nr:metalloregulator ArsR/SmtB family transcription factor [Desulfosporosinus sp. FKB]
MNRITHQNFCSLDCHIPPHRSKELSHSLAQMEGVTPIFKALADETRVKIIYALLQEPNLCVCDLAQITDLTVSGASHHLRLLKNLGLARSHKEGKLVRYCIHDEHVKIILEEALNHCNHLPR